MSNKAETAGSGNGIREKLLTVVIPCYNSEKTLGKTLSSLEDTGTLPELDILIINDGSTDATGQIADDFAAAHPGSARVIHKENGGHGSGINAGIQAAEGKYFKVIDSDDWVLKDGFIHLVEELQETEDDIVYSGFLWAMDDGSGNEDAFETRAEAETVLTDVEYHKTYDFDDLADRVYVKMHTFTVRTAILKDNGIRVDEKCYYEDAEFVTYPVPYVQTIRFLEDTVYMYRVGTEDQSMSRGKLVAHEADYDKVIASMLAFYDRQKDQVSEYKRFYIARSISRSVSTKIKIALYKPVSLAVLKELRAMDRNLKKNYPAVYYANMNNAVTLLRKSGYLLYPLISGMAKRV